jgi:hypothetical protein
MEDLNEAVQLFEASSRLESAATILHKIGAGEQSTAGERQALQWAGRFLAQVDWTAGRYGQAGVSGGLAVQATAVRPTFYNALIGIERHFRDAGLRQEKDVIAFLRGCYSFLIGGGAQKKHRISPEKLRLASLFLRELSQGLLVNLNRNGVPRENELLATV